MLLHLRTLRGNPSLLRLAWGRQSLHTLPIHQIINIDIPFRNGTAPLTMTSSNTLWRSYQFRRSKEHWMPYRYIHIGYWVSMCSWACKGIGGTGTASV